MYYSENDFSMIEKNYIYNLDKEVLCLIDNISSKVNAPEYIKSPFLNKSKKYRKDNNKNNLDWKIKHYPKTEFIKKEGIDANIDFIRKSLNKMSLQNYDLLKSKVIDEIKIILQNTNNTVEEIYNLNKVGEVIFNIASSNEFYSELFATLFYDLMNEFNFIKNVLDNNYENFYLLFVNINYADPNIDYNLFCENNKISEKRKAICSLYANLLKKKVIELDSFINILLRLQNYMIELIDLDNKKEILDEISENIFIIISNSIDLLIKTEKWKEINNNIVYISKIKIKTRPSISNKTIFKHMDLIDIIENTRK